MKKNIFKKLFIKISKILGYEIIDQTEFISPTLEKKLNDDLSLQGFRRSQKVLYRPLCSNCTACSSIRVKVNEFQYSKSQKRLINKIDFKLFQTVLKFLLSVLAILLILRAE